jgi:FAD/FMN-containing dehydrogenase
MIGSWGTLGILCEMTLRLLPLPERMETLLLVFSSLSDAEGFIDRLFETKLLPAAVEILNERAFKRLGVADPSEADLSNYCVSIALEGFEEAVDRMCTELQGMAGDFNAKRDIHMREEEHRGFWQELSNLEIPLASRFSGIITLRLNYPISQWKSVLSLATDVLDTDKIDYTLLAHAGNGLCAINLLMDKDSAAETDKELQAVHALFRRCLELGGNLMVERAPVAVKQHLPIWGEPGAHWRIMKRIRAQLDPEGIMSPGRFVG